MNVIHAIPKLKMRLLREGPEAARTQLAQWVSILHNHEGMRVVLVMDSSRSDLWTELPFGPRGLEVLHAPSSLTADGAIERLMTRLSDPSQSYAVSNDSMIREAVRASGGNALRPEELIAWIDQSSQESSLYLRHKRKQQGSSFGVQLDL